MYKVEYIIQRLHPKEKVWKDHKWLNRGVEHDLDQTRKLMKDYDFGDDDYRLVQRETTVINTVLDTI